MSVAVQKSVVNEKRSLTQTVADTLRREVIAGTIAPDSLIAEVATAERLGVSRVPVREAVLLLEREGLLILEGRSRRRVRTLFAQDFDEILDIRLCLECQLIGLAAKNYLQSDMEAMEVNLNETRKARSLDLVSILDIEFHNLIAIASHHSRLAHLWDVMRGQIQLFTAALHRNEDRITRSVCESTYEAHRELLDLIRIRDSKRVVQLFRTHLLGWKPSIEAVRALEQQNMSLDGRIPRKADRQRADRQRAISQRAIK